MPLRLLLQALSPVVLLITTKISTRYTSQLWSLYTIQIASFVRYVVNQQFFWDLWARKNLIIRHRLMFTVPILDNLTCWILACDLLVNIICILLLNFTVVQILSISMHAFGTPGLFHIARIRIMFLSIVGTCLNRQIRRPIRSILIILVNNFVICILFLSIVIYLIMILR